MKFNDKSDKSEKSSTELLMNQMQIGIMQVTIIIGHVWSPLILNTDFLNAIVDFYGFFVQMYLGKLSQAHFIAKLHAKLT